MPIRRLIRVLGERLSERRRYGDFRSWLLDLYNRVLLRFPGAPLPGRGRVCRVRMAGSARPFLARLYSSDFSVLNEIYACDEYAACTRLDLGPAPLIVDLGANAGYSVRCWQETWPGAAVVAVEPDAANAALCRRNAAEMADAPAPVVIEACVAGRARRVTLDKAEWEWAYSMRDDAGAGAPAGPAVDALTLPDVLGRAGIEAARPIDLLKCDIEGAEREVFEHCADWLGRVRRAVVELHAPYDLERLRADVERAGQRFDFTVCKQSAGLQVVFLSRPDAH